MTLQSEFEFLIQEEKEDNLTFEDESNMYIEQANKFIDNISLYPGRTYQGIDLNAIKESIFIGKTDVMPWDHVSFTINVNSLKDINNDRLKELFIPPFVEELESIGNRDGSEFGYNQFGRNKLKKVIIPKSIVYIAPKTFAFYRSLENVEFEQGSRLLSIGTQAFIACNNIRTIDFRNCENLDEIKEGTFEASGLTTLKINSNTKKIFDISNTDIKTIFIDSERLTAKQFIEIQQHIDIVDYNF